MKYLFSKYFLIASLGELSIFKILNYVAMPVLIIYDIKEPEFGIRKDKEVKKEMLALGYIDRMLVMNDGLHYLPQSSLVKNDMTPHIAKHDLLKIAQRCGASVERLFATEVSMPVAITGKPFDDGL